MDTLGQIIINLLPGGTRPKEAGGPPEYAHHAPAWPGDVFGVAAYLLDRSGAYQRVLSRVGNRDERDGNLAYPSIVVYDCDRKKVIDLAEEWKQLPAMSQKYAPSGVDDLWKNLVMSWDNPLVIPITNSGGEQPDWWHHAMMLMMIADTAAKGLGYKAAAGEKLNWIQIVGENGTLEDFGSIDAGEQYWMGFWVHNWTFLLNQSVCCVVPKSRAPEVGCTLRALSHNLALTPSVGEVRANWWLHREPPAKDSEAMNLLLVPFPYWIPSRAFSAQENVHGNHVFDVEQTWLVNEKVEEFTDFLQHCFDSARLQVGTVHGLILPELSLNDSFRKMVSGFAHRNGIQLFITGMLGDAGSRIGTGNQVSAEVNWPNDTVSDDDKSGDGVEPEKLTTFRHKHHRWKIDSGQIKSYGLGDALHPSKAWWEKLRISHRAIDVFTLSETSTCTTLVCEDLARIDPCQRLIRAVGPSLVIALLMDGPQLKHRWSARYATVLAEDPGASVLTLTSLGLIARTEHNGRNKNRTIGLWKERSGFEVPVILRDDAHAVLLTLTGKLASSTTIDGRKGPERTEWSLAGMVQIKGTDDGGKVPDWILNGQN